MLALDPTDWSSIMIFKLGLFGLLGLLGCSVCNAVYCRRLWVSLVALSSGLLTKEVEVRCACELGD